MAAVTVKLGPRSYPVEIGVAHYDKLRRLIATKAGAGRIFVILDANFYALYGDSLFKELRKVAPNRLIELAMPAGEEQKNQRNVEQLYDFLLAHKIQRSDFVLACGGGVTSDLVGYVAATTVRGVKWGIVSTTLMGMVDASIGGKTGVNHSAGKNLIGAIWQPSFVWSNLEYLRTLPERQIVAGMGEMLKAGALSGSRSLMAVPNLLDSANGTDLKKLSRLVVGAARYKAGLVSIDEREQSVRAFLNYGHTFAHAIERSLRFKKLLHGEAVILGMRAALTLGRMVFPRTVKATAPITDKVEHLLRHIPYLKLNREAILSAMALDKKRGEQGLRFILLREPGKPVIKAGIETRVIEDALERMLDIYELSGGTHGSHTDS